MDYILKALQFVSMVNMVTTVIIVANFTMIIIVLWFSWLPNYRSSRSFPCTSQVRASATLLLPALEEYKVSL
jgi:hypothetical protein